VEINARIVALPNLDGGIADGRAARGEQAATEPGDFADGGRESVVDGDEVVVRVERELVGIERPLGLARRERELLGKEARHGEERGGKGGLAQEFTARRLNMEGAGSEVGFHGWNKHWRNEVVTEKFAAGARNVCPDGRRFTGPARRVPRGRVVRN
jgi:hypothetical protein